MGLIWGNFQEAQVSCAKAWWSWFVIVNHLQLNKNVQKPYAPMHKYDLRQSNIVANYLDFNWIYIKN
jgi:hypothetical protein